LAFTPRTVGQQSGTLSIEEAGGSVDTIQVKGAGLAFTPRSLAFNRQSIKIPGKAVTIQLKNWGDTDLVIPSIIPTGDFKASACAEQTRAIAPGAMCTIAVTFTPTSPGGRAGQLVVTDDGGNQYVAALNGVGLVPIAALDRLIDFGPAQTIAVTRRLTIYNKGEGSLLISSISQGAAILTGTRTLPTPADPSPFSWKDSTDKPCLGAQIPTGDSCVVEVTFTPPPRFANQSAGTWDPKYREYDADLHIIDNDPTSPQAVSLLGNNVAPIQ
jgi:hypothetical protein